MKQHPERKPQQEANTSSDLYQNLLRSHIQGSLYIFFKIHRSAHGIVIVGRYLFETVLFI
jgi:hypothetical protein